MIVVTGSSGFIGSALVEYLLSLDFDVVGFDVQEPVKETHKRLWRDVDICQPSALADALLELKPEYIVHLAGRTDLGHGETIENFSANIDGVKNLMDVCDALSSVKTVIFASTILVNRVGMQPESLTTFSPQGPYGESKMVGEKIIRSRLGNIKYRAIIIRPTSIWGPGYGSHYVNLFKLIYKRLYFHPDGLNNVVTYGYIGNAVYQIAGLIFSDERVSSGDVLYIGDYEPLVLKSWVDSIHLSFNLSKVRVVPKWIIKSAAYFGDFLEFFGYEKFPITSFRLRNMSRDRIYDMQHTKDIIGDLPYDLKSAINETCEWIRRH